MNRELMASTGGGGGRAQCCRSDRAAAPVEGDEAEAGESPPDELGGRRQPHGEELIGNVMLVVRGGGVFPLCRQLTFICSCRVAISLFINRPRWVLRGLRWRQSHWVLQSNGSVHNYLILSRPNDVPQAFESRRSTFDQSASFPKAFKPPSPLLGSEGGVCTFT